MLTNTDSLISRTDAVASLTRLRQEWQDAVDGQNLIDVKTRVGFFLGDVVMLLGLTISEQEKVLGKELLRDLSIMLDEKIME